MSDSHRLIVVSNRLPVVLRRDPKGGWTLRPGSGGLVSALAPVLSQRGGLWIGWPGLAVEPDGEWRELLTSNVAERGYRLEPVVLTEGEVDGFYRGFANGILWPLFHDFFTSCDFDPAFWYAYLGVNEKFARAVVETTEPEDFVWVQDYQLIHVAEKVRETAPGERSRRIGFFLHIPFPPPDIFVRLPWRGQILGALLAYDLLGFQTARDVRNFVASIELLLPEVEVSEGEGLTVLAVGERRVQVGAFPIGIDAAGFEETARSPEVTSRMEQIAARLGPYELILGIDRLDYSKGLPERLLAFADALERYPDLRRRAILLQLVVPSREEVPEYQALKARLDRLVGAINGRFATPGWTPIQYHYRSLPQNDLVALYRMARVGFVTSLKDGMNLVAKEYCACQVEGEGSLVLSELAGAASQLQVGAHLVNPHDIEGTADVLHHVFELGAAERAARMARLREVVARESVFWWLEGYLSAALGESPGKIEPPAEYVPRLDLEEAWVELES